MCAHVSRKLAPYSSSQRHDEQHISSGVSAKACGRGGNWSTVEVRGDRMFWAAELTGKRQAQEWAVQECEGAWNLTH